MLKVLDKCIDILASIAATLIVLVTVVAVFMRWIWGEPISWGEEVLIICFIWMIMLGAASAMRERLHISIDAFTSLLSSKGQLVANLVVHVITMIVLCIFGYLGYQLAEIVVYKITPILEVSYYYIDIAIPVGCFMMAFYTLLHFIKDLKLLVRGE